MKKFFSWVLSRLKEKTTWASLLTVVGTVFGIQFAPEQAEAITSIGLGIVALVLFSTKESK